MRAHYTLRKAKCGLNFWHVYRDGESTSITIVRECLTRPKGAYVVTWKAFLGAEYKRTFEKLAEARAFVRRGCC